MDPIQYLNALRKHWLVIASLLVLGGLGGLAYGQTQPVLYKSTSSVFVSSDRGATTGELVQGSTFAQNLVQSYAELATQPIVLQPVIDELGLDRSPAALARAVNVDIKINTVIIQVTVSDRSPDQAAAIANAITASMSRQVEQLAPSAEGEAAAVKLTPVAQAQPATRPYSPDRTLFLIAGLGIGLALGVAFSVAREMLNTRLRTADELGQLSGLGDVPILGSVTARRGKKQPPFVMEADPDSQAAEEYRRLSTNLEFAAIDRSIRSVVVTSSLAGEGKTTTALNLATAILERGHSVLIVDADLRRPGVSRYLNIEGAAGLTDVLLGGVMGDDAIATVAGVDILPAGSRPPSVTQLIASDAMSKLFVELSSRYDFIIVDAPPVLPVADALSLVKMTDGAILVARAKKTRRHHLVQAYLALTGVNERVLGIVMNGAARTRNTSYGYAASRKSVGSAPRASSLGATRDRAEGFFRNADAGSGKGNRWNADSAGRVDSEGRSSADWRLERWPS